MQINPSLTASGTGVFVGAGVVSKLVGRRAAMLSLLGGGAGAGLAPQTRAAARTGAAEGGPALARPAKGQAEGPALVETAGGRLRGRRSGGVSSFRAIPYAASTAGPNRFRPPLPAAPWSGVREALAFGPSAPQAPANADALSGWYNALQPMSEDCLQLNVWTPSTSGRRPVMVWLHGGAWTSCSGTAPGFDGTVLARDGEVVVVTLNHRLGLFGAIRLDDRDSRYAQSGTAGVLDMVAALAWVRDNIARFGGDPGRVTIFGQSGGAAKVSALLACPAARGLFHRAIAQSCSGSLDLASEAEAARLSHALAARLGLARADAASLRAVPVPALVAAAAALPPMFRPVLDRITFPREPFDPDAPPTAAGIPTLFGNARTETTLYLAADPANFSLGADEVRRRLGRFLRTGDAETARIIDAYRAHLPGATPSAILAAVTTDYTYRRNTTREAALQARAAQELAPRGQGAKSTGVYAYVFDWRTPVMGGVLRSPHTVEVPFVFGTTRAARGLVGEGPDLAPLTRMMVATWSAFAHAGDPANPHLPSWPCYDTATRSTMLLGRDSSVAHDPDGARREALASLPPFAYSMPVNYPRA